MVTKAHPRMIDNFFGRTIQVQTSGFGVDISYDGLFFDFTFAFTAILDAAATLGDGFRVGFINNNVDKKIVYIGTTGAETINGLARIKLNPGESCILVCDGTTFVAAGGFTVFGSFTPTYTGFSSTPGGNVFWQKKGNDVRLQFSGGLGTSDANDFTIINLPDVITPVLSVADAQSMPISGLVDNAAAVWGNAQVTDAGVITFYNGGNAIGWTTSASKGFSLARPTISYAMTFTD